MKTWAYAFILGTLVMAGCQLPRSIPMTGDSRPVGLRPGYERAIAETELMSRRAMSRYRIPGLSIAVVDSRGLIWEAGFGWADDARKVPVDPGTLFSIQSMSKTFTAVGVLTAVRDGLVDLDEPVSRGLPGFTVNSIFEDRPQDRMTVRHLLTHTAGFTHEAPLGGNFDARDPAFSDHVASISSTWLMFRVGERYHYSNLGIDLAGSILARVSGQDLPASLSRRVFEPLGMSRTTADPLSIRSDANRATGHQPGTTDLPVVVPMTAAGGVYSSAHDIGLFLTAMLRGDRDPTPLLTARLIREMETTPNNGGYGLGVGIGRRGEDLFFNHGGGGYGFLTTMAWYPTLDLGIAVLTNSTSHPSAHVALAEKVVDLFERDGLVKKKFPLTGLPVCGISLGRFTDDSWYFQAHPESAAWNDQWSAYLGTWRLAMNATPRWYARLAMRVGLPRMAFVHVRRAGNTMTLDGTPLIEAQPGLFFTLQGECLDFRGSPPTWRNIVMTRWKLFGPGL